MRSLFAIVFIIGVTGIEASHAGPLHDAVVSGTSCEERADLRRDCDYRIGDAFWLSIAAIGTPNATIHFNESSFSGSYFASFLVSGQCVMVSNGLGGELDALDVAYISVRTGFVYLDRTDCESSR